MNMSDGAAVAKDTPKDPKVIDGKAFAEGLRGKLARQVATLKEKHGVVPGLAVVLVGEDPASKVYVRNNARPSCWR
jgi:methylenetetrahydrofolate dehydrogenase (NADP+)/methenyltetrahydrofolate cyclohydrolase